jgi:hypothetical protein
MKFIIAFTFAVLSPSFLSAAPLALNTTTYSLWLRGNGGLYAIANDPDLQGSAFGAGLSLATGVVFAANSLTFSAGLGWAYSSIGVDPSENFKNEISAQQGSVPTTLDTSYAYLDLGLGYKLSSTLHLGSSILLPFGVDTQFTVRENESDDLPHPLLGVKVDFSPFVDQDPTRLSWWYGINLYKDLIISNRDVYQVLASISAELPISHHVERPPIVYKTRYKLREVLVKDIKDRHFISLGVVNFSSGDEVISPADVSYLTAMAQFLAAHSQQWQAVLVGSNRRHFDMAAQSLTKKRGEAITKIFQQQGIKSEQIKTYDLTAQAQEEGSSPFDAVEVIDISLVGDPTVEQLKRDALHLMQRFAIPDTCDAGTCI